MRPTKYAVIAACLTLAVGCGSSGQDDSSPDAGGQPGYQVDGGAGGPDGADGPGGPGGPGGSGKVAAVSGTTAQVQNPTGQVAVSWTAKTAFTQEVATRASALKVGDCVVALPVMSGTGPGQNGEDQPPAGSTADGPVAAATVRVVAPVDGSCSGGMGRGPAPEGDGPGEPPEGAPSGVDGARRMAGAGAFGKVTALSGGGFTVQSALPDGDSTTSTEVTTTAETTWTTTTAATAKAVVVGRCVTSMGRPDATGAITAESITVSSPVDGECAAGFGAPRGMERAP